MRRSHKNQRIKSIPNSHAPTHLSLVSVAQNAVKRLPLHHVARPFAAGFLLFLYLLPYQLQGATEGWWAFAPTTGEAEGGELSPSTSTANGLPLSEGSIMWTWDTPRAESLAPSTLIAQSLAGTLSHRLFGMPTIWPLAAAGLGLGVGVASATRAWLRGALTLGPSRSLLLRWPLAICPLPTLLALLIGLSTAALPVSAGLPALHLKLGVSQPFAVASLLLLLLLPPILIPPKRTEEVKADILLLAIPVWHHLYLLIWPSILNKGLASGSTHPDLYLAIVVATSLSLASHARATLFDTPSHPLMRPSSSRPSRSASADAKGKHGGSSSRGGPSGGKEGKADAAGSARTFGNVPLSQQQQNETAASPTKKKE